MKVDVRKINELMVKQGLSFTELSERSGISKQHISRIINLKVEKVRNKTIKSLADALSVDYKEILNGGI